MYLLNDSTMLLLIPALLLGFIAQSAIRSTYQKYSKVYSQRGLPAYQVVQMILDANGVHNIAIEEYLKGGTLSDHFDPKTRTLRLSPGVYHSSSIAALGVAAHEAGHAIQHAQGYAPLQLRNSIVPAVSITSNLAFPLVLVGLFLGSYPLAIVGVVAYALAVLFQLITLPVELNASNRAIAILGNGNFLTSDELRGAKSVLNAAAMTYLAAAVSAILQLLRLTLLAGRSRKR
jgi:Zn-dependent membrane protease YugP